MKAKSKILLLIGCVLLFVGIMMWCVFSVQRMKKYPGPYEETSSYNNLLYDKM